MLASYCRSYLIFQRNIRISNLLPILVCDMCYHARKINSFPCKGQFNKSRIFRISQGKFNSFKDVRGSWHIPAYSRKLNMFTGGSTLLCGNFLQIHSSMGICFSCTYTNNYEHFCKWLGTFYRDDSLLMRVPHNSNHDSWSLS